MKKIKVILLSFAMASFKLLLLYDIIIFTSVQPKYSSNHRQDAPTTSPEETDQSVRKLLIAAYFRSGSTLISEMATLDNDTFYIFEPYRDLYAAWYSTPAYNEVTYTPAGKRQLPKGERERLVQSLIDMFECRFNRLPVHFYANIFFWILKHHSWNDYAQCAVQAIPPETWLKCISIVEPLCSPRVFLSSADAQRCFTLTQMSLQNDIYNVKIINGTHNPVDRFTKYRECVALVKTRVSHCFGLLEERCKAAKTRVIKEIRLDMHTVNMVVQRYPNMHVLHLVRHPGALLGSRLSFPDVPETASNSTVCMRLRNDVIDSNQEQGYDGLNNNIIDADLSQEHGQILDLHRSLRRRLRLQLSNNVIMSNQNQRHYLVDRRRSSHRRYYLRLRYEDVVPSLQQAADVIYRFMVRKQPRNIKEWIRSRFKTPNNQTNAYSLDTVVERPVEHIDKWIQGVQGQNIIAALNTNRECLDVMKHLNYSVAR